MSGTNRAIPVRAKNHRVSRVGSYRFAANLSFLFADRPFLERFAAASACGFGGVEFLFPYEYAADDLATRLRENRLEMVLFNLPPGDWEAGDRGIASHPARIAEFRAGVERALAYALALNCRKLHCMAGLRLPGVPDAEQQECFVSNLKWAARRVRESGMTILVEPINSLVDMPGYWLDDFSRARRCIGLAAEENLALQFDVYHAQVMSGNAAELLRVALADDAIRVAHVQIADAPGRHEPGSASTDWPAIRELLAGYPGWIGCEYRPQQGTEAGLAWRMQWR